MCDELYPENVYVQVEELADRFDPDLPHARHVADLAVQLFDDLQEIHGLTALDRQLLYFGGMLHDIGWSRDLSKGHNKHSRDMILESDLGFSDADKTMCALITRYHRKAEPDPQKHQRFQMLSREDQNRVRWLAACIRVADGLDRSHLQNVRNMNVEFDGSDAVIWLESNGSCHTEVWGANRKINLLAELLGKNTECRK